MITNATRTNFLVICQRMRLMNGKASQSKEVSKNVVTCRIAITMVQTLADVVASLMQMLAAWVLRALLRKDINPPVTLKFLSLPVMTLKSRRRHLARVKNLVMMMWISTSKV